ELIKELVKVSLKWSGFLGQPSGVARMYPLVDHTAIFSFSPAKILYLGFVLQGLWVGVWRRLSNAQRDLMLACFDAPAKFMSRIGAEKTLTCA
ncbi:hypothetical protein OAC47_05060, partial [Planktomarina temperata]|nr:hypothetical protein [Planktomarina temperata]